MQTFLPYPDFARSAAVLDAPRLGKQRVETLQVLRALELPDYGWANHPAVRMWRGCTPALVSYGLACVEAWSRAGHADSTRRLIAEFAPEVVGREQRELADEGLMPVWLGDERVHASHRSKLLQKAPELYRPLFGQDEPDDLDYFWPEPGPPPRVGERGGRPVWVVRPDGPADLAAFLTEGVVGLGAGSGIDCDASGLDDDGLRALLRERAPGRRPGKELRQLAGFVRELTPGDEVAVPIEGERALLLGEVVGAYRFADPRTGPPPHRRAVRWLGRAERSDVVPPAALQDPRSLFVVLVDL
ncbi:MSMEG_6728 family protein [Kineococcus xinjiangensis]|uniref:MSMEG_6728 family protein n=1 Tax=Kineococcus xinjiangensis TaxID=512762 RepID=UPI000CEBF456|nr:MSMEG_6728 family protein [Kineococcus xinjiangensis]